MKLIAAAAVTKKPNSILHPWVPNLGDSGFLGEAILPLLLLLLPGVSLLDLMVFHVLFFMLGLRFLQVRGDPVHKLR